MLVFLVSSSIRIIKVLLLFVLMVDGELKSARSNDTYDTYTYIYKVNCCSATKLQLSCIKVIRPSINNLYNPSDAH